MSRSEPGSGPARRSRWLDGRGWLALAWVLWFGLLYGKMVVEQRGGRLRALLRPAVAAEAPVSPADR